MLLRMEIKSIMCEKSVFFKRNDRQFPSLLYVHGSRGNSQRAMRSPVLLYNNLVRQLKYFL
jgi:hypothetical protein